MLKNPVYSKNRVYDRKSGTGRGKEISKNMEKNYKPTNIKARPRYDNPMRKKSK